MRGRWVVLDQALSSGSNFLLSFVLVRSISPHSFGAFGIALVTFQAVLSLSRTQVSEPMVIRFSNSSDEDWRRASRSSTGFALVLGVLAAAGMIVVGLFTTGALRSSLITLAIILPALLVQDAWRFAFFAQGRPARAAANDFIWTAIQCGLLLAAVLSDAISITTAILAWGIAATVAAVAGAFQAGCAPRPGRARAWLRGNKVLGGVLSADLVVRSTSMQGAMFAVGALAGLTSVGYLRAGLLLFGPLYALNQAAVPFAVSECVRLWETRAELMQRATFFLSLVLGASGLLLGMVLLLMPDTVGRGLLGESWHGTRNLLPAMTALAFTAGVAVGPAVGLRAIRSVRRLLAVSLVLAPVTIILASGGALVDEANGATWGLVAANAVTASALLWQFRSALRTGWGSFGYQSR